MAAELEEVVVDAHALQAQHVAPDVGQALLGRSAGEVDRGLVAHGELGRGQGPAVQLAARRQGQGLEPDEGGRHHVLGQERGQVRAQLGGRRLDGRR